MDPARFRVNESAPAAATASTAVSSSGPAAVATMATPPAPTTTNPAAPPVVASSAAVTAPAETVHTPPPAPPVSTPIQRAPAVAAASAALRPFASVSRAGYTLQLAAASSPSGFVQRLRELGIAADQAFAVPVQRGSAALWLLCVGEYPDTAAARAAAPAAAGGAFPKALAQLHAEYSGAR
jgi:septal ring-binding cell division protein DamX